jgi:hypothetical protein
MMSCVSATLSVLGNLPVVRLEVRYSEQGHDRR